MSEKSKAIIEVCAHWPIDDDGFRSIGELEAEIDRILSVCGHSGLVFLNNPQMCPKCDEFIPEPKPTETPAKGPTDEELANLKANMACFSPENEENRRFSSVKEAETKLSLVELKEDRRLPFLSREISTKYIEQSF